MTTPHRGRPPRPQPPATWKSTGMDISTSTHPSDWGRAMAVALRHLAEELGEPGAEPKPADVVNRDLILRIEDCAEGVKISITASPRTAEEEQAAAGRSAGMFDPEQDASVPQNGEDPAGKAPEVTGAAGEQATPEQVLPDQAEPGDGTAT